MDVEAQAQGEAIILAERQAKIEELARAQAEAAEAKLAEGEEVELWEARESWAAQARRAVLCERWQGEEEGLAAEYVEVQVRLLQRSLAAARANRKGEYERWRNSLGHTPPDDERTDFATFFTNTVPDIQMPNRPASSELCISCGRIPIGKSLGSSRFEYPAFYNFSQLRNSAEFCELCKLILQSIEQFDTSGVLEINIILAPQALMIEVLNGLPRKPDYDFLRICADPGSKAASIGIKVGFPCLPEVRSDLHFLLLRKWLQVCDESHDDHAWAMEDKVLPTRVLDVGDAENPNLPLQKKAKKEDTLPCLIAGVYLHCSLPKLEDQRKGMEFKKLPQTFQDAVEAIRKFGIQYLWIDSLCIIQDDVEDWARESRKMETVYASAYCTIAATSAKNSAQGFLVPRTDKQSVRLQDNLLKIVRSMLMSTKWAKTLMVT